MDYNSDSIVAEGWLLFLWPSGVVHLPLPEKGYETHRGGKRVKTHVMGDGGQCEQYHFLTLGLKHERNNEWDNV